MLAVLLCVPSLHAEEGTGTPGVVFRAPDGHPLAAFRAKQKVMDFGLEAAVQRVDGTRVPLGGAVNSADDQLVLVSSLSGVLLVFAKQGEAWTPLGAGKYSVVAGEAVHIAVGEVAKESKTLRLVFAKPGDLNGSVTKLMTAMEARASSEDLSACVESTHKNLLPEGGVDKPTTANCDYACAPGRESKSTYLKFSGVQERCSFDLKL
jgi:hypothetical protein